MKFFDIFKKTTKKEEPIKKEKKIEKQEKQKVKEPKKEKVEIQKKTEVIKINFKDGYKILIRPISTEKSTNLTPFNQYVFEVAKDSNKNEIKKAIQAIYNVKPARVNIIRKKGKNKRQGKTKGKTKDWKKAIVTLRKGEKIEVFEK